MPRLNYQWAVELLELDPAHADNLLHEAHEIFDTDYCDSYLDARAAGLAAAVKGTGARVVLVRDDLDPDGWVDHRGWAYVDAKGLPTNFDHGHPVPQRFHDELARAHNELAAVRAAQTDMGGR